LLLAVFAFARRRPSLTDLLMVGAFLWLAWSGQRHVIWFGMVTAPVLVQSLAAPSPRAGRPSRGTPANLAIAILLGLAVLAAQPPLIDMLRLPRADAHPAGLPGAASAFDTATPVGATAYLIAHPLPHERLFNEMGYGAYLDWARYPDAQVFIDPRIELYPLALWEDYIAISAARDYNKLLIDTYDVNRILLDRQIQPKLAKALAADTLRWEREYSDGRAEIYRRK
jgi:hypothetical protein